MKYFIILQDSQITGADIEGRIFKIESKDYYVLTADGEKVRCSLRGRFKKEFGTKKDKLSSYDVASVGDYVNFIKNDDGSGVIDGIKERKNYLSRKSHRFRGANARGERLEQIIASNIDKLFIVASAKTPRFNNRLVDRLIVTAESSGIEADIIINKIDLDKKEDYLYWEDLYSEIGYKVYTVSALKDIGFDEIREDLKGKTSVFWGHSGVGKSSVLNRIEPDLSLKTADISEWHEKGRHTTVTAVLLSLDTEGTFVVDTPGMREMDPFGVKKEDLGFFFREFKPYIHECKFNTCTHTHEPGCAVVDAVEDEQISVERYESYLNLLETIEEDIIF